MVSVEAPLYERVAQRLMQDFGGGASAGTRLPSERELTKRYHVSRVTIRSSLSMLAEQGLIESSAARGWFISGGGELGRRAGDGPLAAVVSRPEASLVAGFSELAASNGLVSTAKVLHARLRPASHDEADKFQIVAGSNLFDLRRLRYLDGMVVAVDRTIVTADLCPGIEDHDFATESLYEVLRHAPEPVYATAAEYSVEATPPGDEEVALLSVPDGTPLLIARQRTFDQRGRLFEAGTTKYRGDRFRFRTRIGVLPPSSAAGRE